MLNGPKQMPGRPAGVAASSSAKSTSCWASLLPYSNQKLMATSLRVAVLRRQRWAAGNRGIRRPRATNHAGLQDDYQGWSCLLAADHANRREGLIRLARRGVVLKRV